jgi:hypothetical protein
MTSNKNRLKHPPKAEKEPQKRKIRQKDSIDFVKKEASWAVGRIDKCCSWGWENITLDGLWGDIHSKLKSFESMNWASIMQNGSHFVEVNKLIPEAQKRLSELRIDDLDELFSLHLTNTKRIWGILDNGVLSIIWYDPSHKICPSPKKHT